MKKHKDMSLRYYSKNVEANLNVVWLNIGPSNANTATRTTTAKMC